jgi:FkbM family methyltransferase
VISQFIARSLRQAGLYDTARAVQPFLQPFSHLRKRRRMIGFYSQFVRPGDLCFDVGANIGDRTKTFLDTGASKVVAIDPQNLCFQRLTKRFGRNARIVLVKKALGEKPGQAEMMVNAAHTLSTLSKEWIEMTRASGRFGTSEWKESEMVEVTTLDHLIETFGMPSFIKIDVEGLEHEVLLGLTQPVQALSFEFAQEGLSIAANCIRHLESLGKGRTLFNYSREETMVLAEPEWLRSEQLLQRLPALPDRYAWGDIYAAIPSSPGSSPR